MFVLDLIYDITDFNDKLCCKDKSLSSGNKSYELISKVPFIALLAILFYVIYQADYIYATINVPTR